MTAWDVGFLDSLAWRVGDTLAVTLHLPDLPPAASVEVRFRDADRRVRRPGSISPADAGSLVEVRVPARRLANGLWRIAVRVGDEETFTRVTARLLVRPGQPVALLPGPAPRTQMSEPLPTRAHGPAGSDSITVARLLSGAKRRIRGR